MVTALFSKLAGDSAYDPNAMAVDKARAIIADLVAPVAGEERVFVRDALGRVLAQDHTSPIDVPPHDNSAMDGYALRCADLVAGAETLLDVAGAAFAGRPFADDFPSGSCVRIMTGAMLPPGTDAVVPQEQTRPDGARVAIPSGVVRGQHLRRAGEDLRAGGVAVPAGRLLRPADVGLLASLGCVDVAVRRRVRVAVFSTGDEVCSLGEAARPGQIYDSNRHTLWSMLRRLGCDVLDLGVVRDNPGSLEATLKQATVEADVIISSGGVSVGEADFVRELMSRLGEVAFWKIAMKPGRPMAFGKVGNAWLFGLPGNPVAVMVTFLQFVRPALLRIAGVAPLPVVPTFSARCVEHLRKAKGRTEFVRGVLAPSPEGWQVRPSGAQGSGILRSMAEANCFIVLDPSRGDVAAGETVTVEAFEGLI